MDGWQSTFNHSSSISHRILQNYSLSYYVVWITPLSECLSIMRYMLVLLLVSLPCLHGLNIYYYAQLVSQIVVSYIIFSTHSCAFKPLSLWLEDSQWVLKHNYLCFLLSNYLLRIARLCQPDLGNHTRNNDPVKSFVQTLAPHYSNSFEHWKNTLHAEWFTDALSSQIAPLTDTVFCKIPIFLLNLACQLDYLRLKSEVFLFQSRHTFLHFLKFF